MFCPQCGSQISDGAGFCPMCGTKLGNTPEAPQLSPIVSEDPVVQEAPVRPEAAPAQPQAAPVPVPAAPASGAAGGGNVPVDASRSLVLWIILSLLTCGLYTYYFIYQLANDMNRMCAGDGDETPGMLVFILLSIVTCGFYAYWWYYKIGNRMQANAPRYGLQFQENGTTILLWMTLGILLCGIGPIIGMHVLVKNANALAAAYNTHLVRA